MLHRHRQNQAIYDSIRDVEYFSVFRGKPVYRGTRLPRVAYAVSGRQDGIRENSPI